MASQMIRDWFGIQHFPNATKFPDLFSKLKQEAETPKPVMVSRFPSGFTLNIIDTPSIVEGGYANGQAVEIIKSFLTANLVDKAIDVLLYVDRLDQYRVDIFDRQVVRAIPDSLGKEIWHRGLVVHTHAQLSPPDGLGYDEFISRRSEAMLKVVRMGAKIRKQDTQNVETPTILVMGKGGVRKSSTVNSLISERVVTASAFQGTIEMKKLIRVCLEAESDVDDIDPDIDLARVATSVATRVATEVATRVGADVAARVATEVSTRLAAVPEVAAPRVVTTGFRIAAHHVGQGVSLLTLFGVVVLGGLSVMQASRKLKKALTSKDEVSLVFQSNEVFVGGAKKMRSRVHQETLKAAPYFLGSKTFAYGFGSGFGSRYGSALMFQRFQESSGKKSV